MTTFDSEYLMLVQKRDQNERYSNLSIILTDTYELTKQVIALRAQLNQTGEEGVSSYVVSELRDKIHQLEVQVQQRINQSTKLTEQNIKLNNQLEDTKEMLFQAETSLHDLNSKYLAASQEAAQNNVYLAKISQIESYLKIQCEESDVLRTVNQSLQKKLAKAVDEKEMYINELIKVKTMQAEILDEASRVSEQAAKKISQAELKLKQIEESNLIQSQQFGDSQGNARLSIIVPQGTNNPLSQSQKSFGAPVIGEQQFIGGARSQSMMINKQPVGNFEQDEIPSGVVSKRKAHDQGCSVLGWSTNYSIAATGGGDGYVRIWDVSRGQEPQQHKIPLCKTISSLTFNSQGNLLACAGTNLEISLMKVASSGLQRFDRLFQGHTDAINGLHFSGSQKQLISASSDRTVRFWDVTTGQSEKVIASTSAIHSIDPSGSDSVFITGHKTGDIRVWSTVQMKMMYTMEKVHSDKIECCKFTRNGKNIISIGRDHFIKISDFSTYKTIATIEHPDFMTPSAGCQFGLSSNGKYLAVGSQNGSVYVFNLQTNELEEIYQGEHTSPVISCAWDPSSNSRLASIDAAGNLFVWE